MGCLARSEGSEDQQNCGEQSLPEILIRKAVVIEWVGHTLESTFQSLKQAQRK